VPAIGQQAGRASWTFGFGLFLLSVLLSRRRRRPRALMARSASRWASRPQFLIAMFPSVNGYFFIPTYGSLIAAINFDLAGTTRIGKYVLNHSFMIPGVVATAVAVHHRIVLARIMVLSRANKTRNLTGSPERSRHGILPADRTDSSPACLRRAQGWRRARACSVRIGIVILVLRLRAAAGQAAGGRDAHHRRGGGRFRDAPGVGGARRAAAARGKGPAPQSALRVRFSRRSPRAR